MTAFIDKIKGKIIKSLIDFDSNEELLEEIKCMTKFSCQADFVLRLYQKKGDKN